MSGGFSPGEWVEVLPAYDTPPILRPDGAPTRGRVEQILEDGSVVICIPIGGADVDEHSQAVPYKPHELVREFA